MSKRRTRPQWQALVDQQRDSDLSATQFCREHAIGYASFCNWRRRLTQSNNSGSGNNHPPSFVDVSSLMNSADAGDPGWNIVLTLGNGVELRLTQTP